MIDVVCLFLKNNNYYSFRPSSPDTEVAYKEDDDFNNLEDVEQYHKRVHLQRKVSRVDSLKRFLLNKLEDKQPSINDMSKNKNANIRDRENHSMTNLTLPQSSDYALSCLDRHDRWHHVQQNTSNSLEADIDTASNNFYRHILSLYNDSFPYVAYLDNELKTKSGCHKAC